MVRREKCDGTLWAHMIKCRSKGRHLREVCKHCGRDWKAHWLNPVSEIIDEASIPSTTFERTEMRKFPRKFTKPDPHEGAEKPAPRINQRGKMRKQTDRSGET